MQPRSMVMVALTTLLLWSTVGHHVSEAQPLIHIAVKPLELHSKASPVLKSLHAQAPAAVTPAPLQVDKQPQMARHTIVEGDTLFEIATQYNTKIENILQHNPEINPDNLKVGTQLQVPVNTVKHTKTREELGNIAATVTTSSSGEPNQYLRKIACKLTAYTNSFESTGKHPGDKGYGITASGRDAKEGLTIAVDPDLIPLHSVVYIPGIGPRYAEDTGGAVKGPHIDVFFNDDRIARDFGVKQANVYIIEEGPRESN
ncbi:3D domain-containing protein [Tumebacillus permanentifrigoris]|uniref:3D (Asp-Asp-Asp) domain-containing protein n=1 Tax=Tumebacillus permanentifrigoris TaxID=378543 RepID=A0A316D7B8_9BACL|nr:3D domain-containing protein [Tumebacillus permanentifrigoris]PWK11356.1 3D (Asp-Asp-Asp) domain-containing protein [Tumebacillus permanentifrigoris]